MPGPMGEKCENCYWYDSCCHHASRIHAMHVTCEWWCDHFTDREERKRGMEAVRRISRRLGEIREQVQNELLDDLDIGKGKVN